jgi:hypothetical protein
MKFDCLLTLLAISLALTPAAAVIESPETGEVAAALEAARHEQAPRFHLIVHRTDEDGQRSLEVFPSGVGTWNRRAQIMLEPALRGSLLSILRERGFAAMAPSYGGKGKPGLQEAAMRITCRVELEFNGVRKTSVQLADGEQSEELAALADALLDEVEPLAKDAVSAADLTDGLRKLADGTLAAEALTLRFVRLPASKTTDGVILMVRGGEESTKDYAPGRFIGDEVAAGISDARLNALTKALLEAEVASLPVNLKSADHVELEVGVLGHRSTVTAREFSRAVADEAAQMRFDGLLDFLSRYEGELAGDEPVVAPTGRAQG